ncbi:MAG: hypothetical protein R2744_12720 [Bacteroidales bacterium]
MELTVYSNSRYIHVRCNIFKDNTFEIVLKDITKLEKSRSKQQITSKYFMSYGTP